MAEAIRRCRPLLGTFVTVEAEGCNAAAVERAFAAVAKVHERMSFHSPTSDLAGLRAAPWGSRVAVSPGTIAVLRFAATLHAESAGLFDVTAAAARLVAMGFLPRPGGIDLRRLTGTAADIEIERDNHVRCHRPLLIDLGGVAKGYAVDEAVASLVADGASGGVVDAGGDLRTFGRSFRPVAIRDGDGVVRSGFRSGPVAVATSGNRHARRRLRGAATAPHLDGRRRPILAAESVTVLAERCIVADAFTKIAMADRLLAGQLLPAHRGALLDAAALDRAA